MKYLIFLLLVAFASCNPAKKATKYMRDHPEVNAPVCADQFPIREVTLPGDTVTVTDTLETFEVLVDTLRVADTLYITRTTQPKIIRETRTVVDTVIRENTARIGELLVTVRDRDETIKSRDDKITKQGKDNDDLRTARNRWRLYFFLLLGAVGVYGFLKFKRILP
jgi:hypothetical protein